MQSKQHSISTVCPVCKGQMMVKELECEHCDIQVRGNFGVAGAASQNASRFDSLTGDQMVFLETFLRCRGIIRDVEAALGISYPTVRARLDSLLTTLALTDQAAAQQAAAAPVEAEKPSIKDILSKLDSGKLDAQAALDALRNSSNNSK